MKREVLVLFVSAVLVFLLGINEARSVTVEIRDLQGSNEIQVDPYTDFQVQVFIDLSPDEIAQGIAGYELYIKLDPLIEYRGHTDSGGYDFTFVNDPDESVIRMGGVQVDSEPLYESHVVETLDLYCNGPGDFELVPISGEIVTSDVVSLEVGLQGLSMSGEDVNVGTGKGGDGGGGGG